MIAILLAGMAAGAGLWLIARGWCPPRPSLAGAIEGLAHAGWDRRHQEAPASRWQRVAGSLAAQLGGSRAARRPFAGR